MQAKSIRNLSGEFLTQTSLFRRLAAQIRSSQSDRRSPKGLESRAFAAMSALTSSLEAAVGSSPDLAVARSGKRFCRPLHRQYALHQGRTLRQHICSASGFGTQRTAASRSSAEPLSDLNRVRSAFLDSAAGFAHALMPLIIVLTASPGTWPVQSKHAVKTFKIFVYFCICQVATRDLREIVKCFTSLKVQQASS